ncbi:MAG: radical SAM protein [Oscillospiraceae bacterium]|nr:radical SAM protein [Oscillospiraceae bacterium]
MPSVLCDICPRNCKKYRDDNSGDGFCGSGRLPKIARAALHYWEEPPISGDRGSGTVFFSGCSLKCVFCQNYQISAENYGKTVSVERLREIYKELEDKGAHNINLVNPTHYAEAIAKSLENPPNIPVVYNCGGYEKTETLKMLEGKIDIYIPDIKYSDDMLAKKYSKADGYFEIAKAATEEMYRQTGRFAIDENGIMKSGVIIRHLVLPGHLENTFGVIDYVSDTFAPGQILFSLMSQYTPCGQAGKYPEINRRLNLQEYETVREYLENSDIEDGFVQELSSAKEEYIPEFDLEGV